MSGIIFRDKKIGYVIRAWEAYNLECEFLIAQLFSDKLLDDHMRKLLAAAGFRSVVTPKRYEELSRVQARPPP